MSSPVEVAVGNRREGVVRGPAGNIRRGVTYVEVCLRALQAAELQSYINEVAVAALIETLKNAI